ncbi:hypothetical protein HID58_048086 [Brassica napus]|uniref:Uncharacterized protein n=1 Tax=Brassica napus TaxID=3708 RepID=A0ABQ8B1C3_BRANA|nr:hypothetical protein HID58_048086 [Brassica napus]
MVHPIFGSQQDVSVWGSQAKILFYVLTIVFVSCRYKKLKALNPEANQERKEYTSTGNDPKSKKSLETAVILNAELLVV